MSVCYKADARLVTRKWHGVACAFSIGLVLVGCSASAPSTNKANEKTMLLGRSECGTLVSTGSRLYLTNSCNTVRAITIEWRFSSSNGTEQKTYRLGTWSDSREIQVTGTVGKIISDIPAPLTGTRNAINDVVIETTPDQPEPGAFTLWVHNKSNFYVFAGIRLADPNDPHFEKRAITPFVLAPPSIHPRPVPIFTSLDAPGKYRVEIAEYEPR